VARVKRLGPRPAFTAIAAQISARWTTAGSPTTVRARLTAAGVAALRVRVHHRPALAATFAIALRATDTAGNVGTARAVGRLKARG
jgi:hypothetical protein